MPRLKLTTNHSCSMGDDTQQNRSAFDLQSIVQTYPHQTEWDPQESFPAYSTTHIAPYTPQQVLPTPPRSPRDVCTVKSSNYPHTFVFRCASPQCHDKTFGRWSDFHRHYNGAHAPEKTIFWCPVAECSRNERFGNRGFPRKDKMMVHVAKMHANEMVNEDMEYSGLCG